MNTLLQQQYEDTLRENERLTVEITQLRADKGCAQREALLCPEHEEAWLSKQCEGCGWCRCKVLEDNMREIELALGFDEPDGMTLAQARTLVSRLLLEPQTAALAAWAEEQHREGGCSAWGPKFDAAMAVAESFRETT